MNPLQEAIQHFQGGDLERAEALCGSVLETAPSHVNAGLFRAFLRLELGRPGGALADLDRVLAAAPGHGEAWGKRANALLALGRIPEALTACDRALALEPGRSETHICRAAVLLRSQRPGEALAAAEAALALDPRDAEARINRASALLGLDRPEEALADLDQVLAAAPDRAEAQVNRGNALSALDRWEAALTAYDAALARRPDCLEAKVNRGLALQSLGRFEEALKALDEALERDPEEPNARTYRGFLKLLLGRLEEGWPDYEARWARPDLAPHRRAFGKPQWQGGSLEGRTLLLHAEQGLGDTLQFARYIPAVARQGRVLLEVQGPLRPLFEGLPGVATLCREGEAVPPFDLHCPLGSLPLAFRTSLDSVPAPLPHFRAPAGSMDRAAGRFSGKGLKVGFAWAGNPAHRNDQRRSLPLAAMSHLFRIPGIQAVALQKELGEADRALLAEFPGVLNLGPEFRDFGETAAVLAQLDLVITVDTALAHLAGALGRPVWILLPFLPDWRWLLGREDSPWYPTARLFRQDRPGDWRGPIARAGSQLAAAAGGGWGHPDGQPGPLRDSACG